MTVAADVLLLAFLTPPCPMPLPASRSPDIFSQSALIRTAFKDDGAGGGLAGALAAAAAGGLGPTGADLRFVL